MNVETSPTLENNDAASHQGNGPWAKPRESKEKIKENTNKNNNSLLPLSSLAGTTTAGRRTVIIFDWDDTLVPTSYLAKMGLKIDNNLESKENSNFAELNKELRELETIICKLLNLALEYGDVNIITNSERGWVELFSKKFLPGIMSTLAKVKIISARSTYEVCYPDSPFNWKLCAFYECLFKVFGDRNISNSWSCSGSEVIKNVISFGDSNYEREAIITITRDVPGCRRKSLKLGELPTLSQLTLELELVTSCFSYIHDSEKDLDLQLTIEETSKNTKKDTSSNNDNNNSDDSRSIH